MKQKVLHRSGWPCKRCTTKQCCKSSLLQFIKHFDTSQLSVNWVEEKQFCSNILCSAVLQCWILWQIRNCYASMGWLKDKLSKFTLSEYDLLLFLLNLASIFFYDRLQHNVSFTWKRVEEFFLLQCSCYSHILLIPGKSKQAINKICKKPKSETIPNNHFNITGETMSWKCLKVKNKSWPTAITRKHLLAQDKNAPNS